jgi:hypothetical protein
MLHHDLHPFNPKATLRTEKTNGVQCCHKMGGEEKSTIFRSIIVQGKDPVIDYFF